MTTHDPAGQPRPGHPIEALDDVVAGMRAALARQEQLGYRDDAAVVQHTVNELAARASSRSSPPAFASAADPTSPDTDHGARHATPREGTMQDQPSRNPDADRMEALAASCEQGADTLTHEAEHAAEVLATRAGADRADPQAWADRKRGAATAARVEARHLRTQAALLRESGGRADPALLAQAEKVATAANVGGILIDGSRLHTAASEHPNTSDEHRRGIEQHAAQHRAAIEGSGRFGHVAEDGQVPFWQLGTDPDHQAAQPTTQPAHGDGHAPAATTPTKDVAARVQRATESLAARQAATAAPADSSGRAPTTAQTAHTSGPQLTL